MVPKPVKDSAQKDTGNKNWEAALTSELFEEDSWKACVSLVVETCPEVEVLVGALSAAVQKPLRKLFSLLTWDDTQTKIHEFGNPKNKKRDNVPKFSEVTEPAKVVLDAGEEIPVDLLAKLVKFQLLQIKSNDQQRRQTELVKPAEEKAKEPSRSATKDKDKGDKKGKPSSTVLEKKTKLKRRDDVDPPDYIDDEPDDGPQHYILIVGFYHPHLFRALDSIGVQISNVIKLSQETKEQQTSQSNKETENIPINDTEDEDCRMRLAAQAKRLDHFWSGLHSHLDSGPPYSKLHDVAELSYSASLSSDNRKEPEAMLSFGSSIFEDVACLIYDTLDKRRQHQHYLDNLKIIDVPKLTAPDPQPVDPVVSTSLPHSKKKLAHEDSPSVQETKVLSTDVDMSHYTKLLDTVPPEACSVPLVLHCILEQVVLTSDPPVPAPFEDTEESTDSGPFLDQQLVSCMLHEFLPLVYTENEKSHLLNSLIAMVTTKEDKKRLLEQYGTNDEKATDPQIFRHHDERALRLRNCKTVEKLNPMEVEENMLRFSPVFNLIQSVSQQKNASCWMAIKQQLQYYCPKDVVPWPDVERLFDQSVFESMPLTQLDQSGVLLKPNQPLDSLGSRQDSTTAIPWDNPLSFAKQQLWQLQNLGPTFATDYLTNAEVSKNVPIHLELSDIQSCRRRSFFDWHYTEHHSVAIFPQVLQEALEQYRCFDTFQGSNKKILYIYCHNPMTRNCQYKESWDVALHTNVKFRKYLENVADKISEWTKEEEAKREAMMNKAPVATSIDVEDIAPTPIDNVQEPVIRKESLKAWKLEQERLKEEELAKKHKKEPVQKDKQAKEDAPDSAMKGRVGTASSAKTLTDSFKAEETKETKETKETHEEFNGFIGYDMEGKLIHVSGNLHYLYPSDGGCIIVETADYVEGSSLMKVAVKKDGHSFYTHINHIVEELTPDPEHTQPNNPITPKEENKVSAGTVKVKQGSLTAVLNSGVRLSYSFYGPTGQHRENTQESEHPEISSNKNVNHDLKEMQPGSQNTPQSTSSPTEPPIAQEVETGLVAPCCSFNSLSLSLPNGLLLQLLREDSQGVPSEEVGILIRLSFPSSREIPNLSLSKEASRLITSQGAVVRNMKDGSTEVLFPDGSVSSSQDSGPVWAPVSDPNTTQETMNNTKARSATHNKENERGFWSTTTPSGARISTVGISHKCLPTPPLLIFKSTDPKTKEVMLTREDGVVSVQNPDGSIIVEHADGTRITSLYEESLPIHRGERPESTILKSSSAESEVSLNIRSRENTSYAYLELGNKGRAHTTIYENSHESLSDSRKSSPSENECVPMKEKVVLVEREGCATVVMYPDRCMAHIFLADGTVITGNNKGAYQVFPNVVSNVGLLQIHSDGKYTYTSDPLDTPQPGGGATINKCGTYTMSHCDGVACDITDQDGNHFQVMEDGTISVSNLSPASGKFEKDDEEDLEMAGPEKRYEHSPRLFIAHENGSGTELLLSQKVEDLLFQAYSDPTVAVMKEPLPDTQDEFGITILRPGHESVWSQWLLAKQKSDITPPNLRNRSWNDFPRAEKPTAGPPFGTDMGRCLSFTPRSGAGSVIQNVPVRSCPKVLVMRELQQHRPFTSPLRNNLDAQLKEYIESLMEKEQRSEQMKIKDPRSEKESGRASDLLHLVLSFAEDEDLSQSNEKQISEITSLYMQGVSGQVESDPSEETSTSASESFAIGSDSQWTGRLAMYRQELFEEKACRDALRKKTIVPYFHLENLPLYECLLHQELSNTRIQVSSVSPKPDIERKEKTKKRPSPKPTKSRASLSPSSTALKISAQTPIDSPYQAAAESKLKTSAQYKSVNVDVTGQPRKSKVRLPTCIKTTKPSSVPNYQFLSVEEPVRRKCRTVSLLNPGCVVRGFHLHPPCVDFGSVQEGSISSVTVLMKNVGVDTCRFSIKQPPPSTGLRVIYNPGPVAAGLHVEIQVQLLALYSVQPGESETRKSLSQDITIHTETDIIYLPVVATILSERLYEMWRQEQSREHNRRASRTSKLSNSATLQATTQLDFNSRLSL